MTNPAQPMRCMALLDGIPGVLIHGHYDVTSPLEIAWRLHQSWSTSELHILDDAGHSGGESFYSVIAEAQDRFAQA